MLLLSSINLQSAVSGRVGNQIVPWFLCENYFPKCADVSSISEFNASPYLAI